MKKITFFLSFVLSLTLIIYFYSKLRSFELEKLYENLSLLHKIKESDLNFNQTVLKSKISLIRNYDLFTIQINELETNLNLLKSKSFMHNFYNQPEQDEWIEKLTEIIKIKKVLIEKFKPKDALIKIGLNDINEIIRNTSSNREVLNNSLIKKIILELYLTDKEADLAQLIEEIRIEKSRVTNKNLRRVLISCEAVINYQKEQEDIIESILNLPSEIVINKLLTASILFQEENKSKSSIYRLIIGFLVFIIIAISLMNLIQLKIKEISLMKLNFTLADLNSSFEKYVPHEFFLFFPKKEVIDIKLGNYIEEELFLLYTNLEYYFNQKNISHSQRVVIVNNIYREISPYIRKNSGFIEKYSTNHLYIYFKLNQNLLSVAHEITSICNHYLNIDKEDEPVYLCIHYGKFIFGLVGVASRMNSSIQSESIDLINQMQSLAKIYKLSLLVSQEALPKKNPIENIRLIEKVFNSETREESLLYEVFEFDPIEIRTLKAEILTDFNLGVEQYFLANYKSAKKYFSKCLKIFPNDQASIIYSEKCNSEIQIPKHSRLVGANIFAK
jgi:hypothetical protein